LACHFIPLEQPEASRELIILQALIRSSLNSIQIAIKEWQIISSYLIATNYTIDNLSSGILRLLTGNKKLSNL